MLSSIEVNIDEWFSIYNVLDKDPLMVICMIANFWLALREVSSKTLIIPKNVQVHDIESQVKLL
jgi:hypothetical protein